MNDFPKFFAATDGAEGRPLETDLYITDPQGLDADNIAASGNLNIGMIVDYDARTDHRTGGGAQPTNSFHSDGATTAIPEISTPPGSSTQGYYNYAPANDAEEPTITRSSQTASDKGPNYQPSGHIDGPSLGGDDGAAHRAAGNSQVTNISDPQPPIIIHDGGGDTTINNTYNTIDNSNTTYNYTQNNINIDDHSTHNMLIDIDILNNNHGGHGGHHGGGDNCDAPPCNLLPTIINNVFNEVTGITQVIDHTVTNITSTVNNIVDSTVLNTVVNTVSSTVDTVITNIFDHNGGGNGGTCELPNILPPIIDLAGGVVGTVECVAGGVVGGVLITTGDILHNVTDITHNLPGTLTGAVDCAIDALPCPLPQVLGAVDSTLHTVVGDVAAVVCDPAAALCAVTGTLEGVGGGVVGTVEAVAAPLLCVVPEIVPTAEIVVGDVLGTVGGLLTNPTALLDTGAGLLTGAGNLLPSPVPEVVAGVEGLAGGALGGVLSPHDLIGGLIPTAEIIVGSTLDGTAGLLNGEASGLPAPLPEMVFAAEHTFGDALGTATSLVSDPGHLPGTLESVVAGLADTALPLGASLLSSVGTGIGSDGAPIPGALAPVAALAEPVTSILSDLHLPTLSQGSIAPLPEISLPVNSIAAILPGNDVTNDVSHVAGSLPISDAQNALTMLAMVDHAPAAIASTASDAGHLLSGTDAHGTVAHVADVAASLPAPVITPVVHLASSLFHH